MLTAVFGGFFEDILSDRIHFCLNIRNFGLIRAHFCLNCKTTISLFVEDFVQNITRTTQWRHPKTVAQHVAHLFNTLKHLQFNPAE